MRKTLTIARKELKTYFTSPIAYLFLAMFAVIFGFFFYSITAIFVARSLQAAQFGGAMGMPGMNLNEMVIRPLLMNVGVTSLFLLPMVTMRLFAEEKKSGTIELLLTSPVTTLDIILGKFLAATVLYGGVLLLTLLYLLVLFFYGTPAWRPLVAGMLGLGLLGASLLALGMMVSTFTRNQIIAGSLTFGLFLLLWVFDWTTAYSSGGLSKLASYISITEHLENFAKGVIDLRDVVYYLSLAALGLFLTARSMDALKGRP